MSILKKNSLKKIDDKRLHGDVVTASVINEAQLNFIKFLVVVVVVCVNFLTDGIST